MPPGCGHRLPTVVDPTRARFPPKLERIFAEHGAEGVVGHLECGSQAVGDVAASGGSVGAAIRLTGIQTVGCIMTWCILVMVCSIDACPTARGK